MHGRVLTLITTFVALIAILGGHPLMLRLAWALGGLLMVSFFIAWTSVRWVDVGRRTYASRAEVGGLAEEWFSVTNRGWVPKLWLEIRDESDLPGHFASRVVSALGPSGSRSWTARTVCRRRGMYRLGPMVLVGGDPLGIFQREQRYEQTAPFVVFPLTYAIKKVDLPTGYLSGGQVVRQRSEAATTNVRGVRGYLPGDAFNRIHWATTARRGALHTKEFELDPIADFWILVDLDRSVHVGESSLSEAEAEARSLPWMEEPEEELEPSTEEYTVSAAASLARYFLDSGKSVGLIAHGQRRVVVRPDRGERQITKILTHLAVLRATGRAGLSDVLSLENHEFKRHTTLVVVSPTTSLRWIEALREFRNRGVGSLVVHIEPTSFGTAGSSEGVMSALAANQVKSRAISRGDHIGAVLEGG
jgi:uncharacterized protein (DUF58 family)